MGSRSAARSGLPRCILSHTHTRKYTILRDRGTTYPTMGVSRSASLTRSDWKLFRGLGPDGGSPRTRPANGDHEREAKERVASHFRIAPAPAWRMGILSGQCPGERSFRTHQASGDFERVVPRVCAATFLPCYAAPVAFVCARIVHLRRGRKGVRARIHALALQRELRAPHTSG